MLYTTAFNTNTIRRQTGAAERHSIGRVSNSCYYVFNYSIQLYNPIRCDTRCYFNMQSKADMSHQSDWSTARNQQLKMENRKI